MQALELTAVLALIVPAADAVYDAGAVHGGELLCHLDGIELPPALVEDDPHAEGDAVLEVAHGVLHLGDELAASLLVGAGEELVAVVLEVYADEGQHAYRGELVGGSAGHHILPHDDAFAVAVVVPPQGLDLDMFPYHVEAHGLDEFDIVFEGGVGGRSEHPVRPIALIEHARLEVGHIVEREALEAFPVRHDREFAHPEIGADDILADLYVEVVELGVLGRPELVFGHGDDDAVAFRLLIDEGVDAVGDDDIDAVRAARDIQLEHQPVAVDIGEDGQVFEVGLGDALHPHRLPYTGLRGVPYPAVLDALFAAGVPLGVRGVGDGELEGVRALPDGGGDIK